MDLFITTFGACRRRTPRARSNRRAASEKKGLGEARLFRLPSDRPRGPSAFAVGVLRDIEKKTVRHTSGVGTCGGVRSASSLSSEFAVVESADSADHESPVSNSTAAVLRHMGHAVQTAGA